MFDIGFTELLMVGVVSLIVFGPERLPGVVRTVGFWVGRARRTVNDLKSEFRQELHNADIMAREQELQAEYEHKILADPTMPVQQEYNPSHHALSAHADPMNDSK